METEKKLKGIAKLKHLLFLLKPYWKYGKLYMIISLIGSVVLTPVSAYLTVKLPANAIDAVVRGDSGKQILIIVISYSAAILVINLITNLVGSLYGNVRQVDINYKIMHEVNEKALYTDYKYYDNPDFYAKFSYAQQQYAQQSTQMMTFGTAFAGNIVSVIIMGVVIINAGPILIAVTLGCILLSFLFQIPTIKMNVEMSVKVNDMARPINYVYRVMQQKENTAEMRTSGAGIKLLSYFKTALNKYLDYMFKFLRRLVKWSVASTSVSRLQTSIILLYIIFFIIDGDVTKIGQYALLTGATASLASNIQSALAQIQQLASLTLYGERIQEFFNAKNVIEPPEIGGEEPPEGVYSVELRNVDFSYENASGFKIENFNLTVNPGQRVALVGENGAGKSTLTKLLLRLYDVSGGDILINGKDIREYDVHKLRRHIGIAYQDIRILAMSLRDNLTVYSDVSDEKLMEVISKLGLENVIEKAGGDFDKMVSREFTEDGIVLSGGEAQRVAIARLFTTEFGLIMLDEPSSALDPLAEHKLLQTIEDTSNKATTIMIAHRLSTVRNFDIIHYIEDGKIVESGKHDELMNLGGKYFEMFSKQAENYQDEGEAPEPADAVDPEILALISKLPPAMIENLKQLANSGMLG